MDPLGDALLDVLRIGIELHSARALERLERADHRGELHAVVGGGCLAAPELFFGIFKAKEDAPSARTRVAAAGAVAVDLDHILSHGSCGCGASAAARSLPGRDAGRAPGATRASRGACRAPASLPAPRRCRRRSATSAPRPSP